MKVCFCVHKIGDMSVLSSVPTSSMPKATDDNLYDMVVPPFIGNTANTILRSGYRITLSVARPVGY